jgi:competence protein ComFC
VRNFKEKDVVIVDDIVTTGWTLTQAIQALKEKNILFCLTLADASL